MDYKNNIKDGEINIFVNKSLYSIKVLYKVLYWYTDKFHVNVLDDEKNYLIRISANEKSKFSDEDLNSILFKFERDLIDYNLREIINNETKTVKELLIAKAFSNGDYEETPPGDISDPVGFKI
jgi:His-Xaa-Ser system protein HxsD